MPHFKACGMMNWQYEIRIRKGTMSQSQIQVTIFLSGTDISIFGEKNQTNFKNALRNASAEKTSGIENFLPFLVKSY